jgi:hypothetical protein
MLAGLMGGKGILSTSDDLREEPISSEDRAIRTRSVPHCEHVGEVDGCEVRQCVHIAPMSWLSSPPPLGAMEIAIELACETAEDQTVLLAALLLHALLIGEGPIAESEPEDISETCEPPP